VLPNRSKLTMNVCNLAARYAPLAGRLLLSALFFQSGWHKITDFSGNVAVMSAKGIPSPEVLLGLTIVLVVGGGLMILFGWHARWAAAVLFAWMIPVTLLYHDFWTAQPAQLFNQTTHFMKNLAIMGALLHLFGMGPGPLSLNDGRGGGTDGGVA
jgi:putative oxidoreductase